MTYSIQQHNHRFAAWAAGRAASVIGRRFSVAVAKDIIEASDLILLNGDPRNLPQPPNIDATHRIWREQIISLASQRGLELTHGVAAKIINVYLKSIFVCGGQVGVANVNWLHPPIDSVLLDALASLNFGGNREIWNRARRIRWSKFNSDQYEAVIFAIRASLPSGKLWEIEQYWQGHQ